MPDALPDRPHLDFYRRQARKLLRGMHCGEANALTRWRKHHPVPDDEPRLGGAQFVVAREQGFASWPRLKRAIALRRLDRDARAGQLVASACSRLVRDALMLLSEDRSLARHDLATACACGEVMVVADVLKRDPGAANRPLDAAGRTPLLIATHSRVLRADPVRAVGIEAIVGMLLDAGADPNAVFFVGSELKAPQSALYGAAGIANHAGLTRRLLEAGADVNDTSPEPDPSDPEAVPWGTESLYHATEFPDPTCLSLLLAAQPYRLAVDYCLGRALDFDYPRHVLLYLEHGADPNFRVPWQNGRSHLLKAVMQGRSASTIAALLDAGGDPRVRDDEGVYALQYAVCREADDVADLLVRAGADPAVVTPADRQGTKVDTWLLCDAASRNDADALTRLLDNGADPDAMHDGLTPLHQACWTGQAEAAILLLKRGADPRRRHRYGGDAVSTVIHGSTHCFEPQGGGGMRLPDEVAPRGYAVILEHLIALGAPLPDQIADGSDAVQDVLRRHGVPDPDD